MNKEWIYRQVIENNEKRFIETFQTEIEYFATGARITHLPVDVLALLLSFIELKDVRNCMRVSKLFYEATKKDQFWNRFIKQRLENALVEPKFIPIIGNFYFPEYLTENFKTRYEWLFRKLYLKCSLTYKKTFQIERFTDWGIGRVIRLKIDVESLKIHWLELHDIDYIVFKDLRGIDAKNRHVIDLLLKNEYVYSSGEIKKILGRISKYNAKWIGSCIRIDKIYHPHGRGKWTFDDGTILEGDNVAKNGEPVFTISYDDWVRLRQCNRDQKPAELSECKTCPERME